MNSAYGGLLIVGPSAAGKTTLYRRLRDHFHNEAVDFPMRITTRPVRHDDSPDEQRSVTPSVFRSLIHEDKLWCWWTKEIPFDDDVRYGFEHPAQNKCVLAANSDILLHPDLVLPTPDLLKSFKKVLVTCDPSIRRERLMSRSPELVYHPNELSKRLKDDTQALKGQADFILDASNGLPADAFQHLCAALSTIQV